MHIGEVVRVSLAPDIHKRHHSAVFPGG